MVQTAATLFQRQGYAATGWRQVIAESETPWGSQSHHFPDGKQELAIEAIAHSGGAYETLVRQAFADAHPAEAIQLWVGLASHVLEASAWTDGCPIATVALELAHESEDVGKACKSVFLSWRLAMAEGIEAAGAEATRASELATIILASIEGALVLARAERSSQPLRIVGDDLARRLQFELPAAS